ncbi:MAG: helix-turn-helix transcriptional regulator [Actinomycetia bacterium]|nr:helix-turn-helix transcriptional regulator [Actinomycetes bacterium]MCP4084990.1 helix-turn-helix transcriptional regulator [Actinomycetes bacterium]
MSDPLTTLPELQTMKVLADDTRHALFVALRGAGDPLTTRELSELVGLHPNTVRPHLDRLCQAGLVESDTHGHGQVGRPQHRFQVVGSTGPANPGHPCVEAVVDHARRLGFVPACTDSDDGVTVSFGACPFGSDEDLDLACSLHEGLIEGVVEHYRDQPDTHDETAVLDRFVARSQSGSGRSEDGPCRAELRVGDAGLVADPS